MDATHFEMFVDALINDLAPSSCPSDDGDRRLFHLLECPRPVIDEQPLLAVLAAAVTASNLINHVIAQATAAAERLGIPARERLRSGADLLTRLGVAPAAAYRAARVGRAAPPMPALTGRQRLGGLGIEFVDAVGKGVAHVNARVQLSDDERAQVVRTLMIQTTPSGVNTKARDIAIAKASVQPPPEGEVSVPVAENADLNDMALVQNEEGRVTGILDLDALTGEELFAALDPLCRPVPLPDGSPDPRSTGRRRADAFGQLIRTFLSSSGRPASGGVLPHVTLLRPGSAPRSVRALGDQDVDTLGFTGPISAVTADLIACDASVGLVFVDENGAPLDVGRSERLFPRSCVKRWWCVIGDALSLAAGDRCPGAMRTISTRGRRAELPVSTMVCCSAGVITR